MITRIRKQVFGLRHIYSNPLDAQRAQVLLFLNIAVVVVTLISLIFITIPAIVRTGNPDIAGFISSLLVVIAAVISYRLIQHGRLNLAIWINLVAVTIGSLNAIVFGGSNGTPSITTGVIMFLPIPIIMAGVLLGRRGLITITLLTLAVVVVSAAAETSLSTPTVSNPVNQIGSYFFSIVISILSILFILFTFLGSLQRIASDSFEVRKQLQHIKNLRGELGKVNNEQELLVTALNQSRQIFGQRFIEIYLINEDGNLTLASSAGRRSTIRSIDSNILAEAARGRTLLTASLQDPPELRSHMAASTSYAAAVPIMVPSNILGILDFQAVVPFTQNDLDIIQELADQIALSLQHLRVTTEMKTLIDDQEKTVQRLQTQLQDFDRRQQQNVGELWGSYIQGRGKQAIGYNLDSGAATPVQATDLPSGLVNTLKSGQLDVSTQGSEQIINVPIRFRETNLGAMSFAVPADQPLSQRQIEVATTVAERLALALENTRLFEQSQSQALRERKASEVATALIGATDVRVVLNMAAEQFKNALGAVNTRIYIQPETLMEPLAQPQGEQGQ